MKILKNVIILVIGIGIGSLITLRNQKIQAQNYQSPEIVCCSDNGEHLAYSAESCLVHQEERTEAYNTWLAGWMEEIWRDIKGGWDKSYE